MGLAKLLYTKRCEMKAMTDSIQDKIDQAVRLHELRHHGGRKVFVPPTAEEVKAYAVEAKLPLNVTEFVDFYTEKGWMVGKTKMKDWKAAARRAAREWAKDLKAPWLQPGVPCHCGCGRPSQIAVGSGRFASHECRKKVLGW